MDASASWAAAAHTARSRSVAYASAHATQISHGPASSVRGGACGQRSGMTRAASVIG